MKEIVKILISGLCLGIIGSIVLAPITSPHSIKTLMFMASLLILIDVRKHL